MDDNCGVGGIYGCGKWVWLVGSGCGKWVDSMGVVSGCCCKEVYRIPHNMTYPNSTCISSFFAAASLLLSLVFKRFFRSCLCYFGAI